MRFLKVSCFYGFVIILTFPIVCNMTSLAVIGARPLTPPSPQGCPPPAILDKRSLRRFFRSGLRCQQNVATYPGGQRRNKDRVVKKDKKIKRHTNQERQPSKDFLDGIGCRYVDLQFGSLYSRTMHNPHKHKEKTIKSTKKRHKKRT